ncbi:MAG: DNA repair protein, partial [Deltaproteobacteria bacterium]|nr:DNA repair protein [Deltaproteobacteria bacterium]
ARGEGARTVASRVLDHTGGLAGLARLGVAELALCRGLGPAKAGRLLSGVELGRRAVLAGLGAERPTVSSFAEVVAWARPRLATLEHEEVWLLTLDGRNGLVAALCVARGGAHACALTPRDVLRPALRAGGSGMVLVHNHPSGDPTPSRDDLRVTELVALAGEAVALPLLDHVVVARGGATSIREFAGIPR